MVARHAEWLGRRVQKRFRTLKKRFARQNIEAYRLYDRDIPEIRAVVDWYAGHVVVSEYTRQQTEGIAYLETLGRSVAEALNIPSAHVHLKRRRTRPQHGPRYERLAHTEARLVVKEGDLRFWVNLDDYLDTGLFSDHRITRRRVRSEVEDRRFLNLFGYTGSFTVAAAIGGAKATTTVDLSQNYLTWAADNLRLNEIDPAGHEHVADDVIRFLDQARRKNRTWDVAVVDPPSFSTRGGPRDFDVMRDHGRLLESVFSVMAPHGVVYFSTNHQRFVPDFDGLPDATAEELTPHSLPEDYARTPAPHRAWRFSL